MITLNLKNVQSNVWTTAKTLKKRLSQELANTNNIENTTNMKTKVKTNKTGLKMKVKANMQVKDKAWTNIQTMTNMQDKTRATIQTKDKVKANIKAIFRQKSPKLLLTTLKLYSIALLLPFSLTLSLNIQAGGWVDDWLDQSVSSGANYFEGQKRNYFSGGTYSMRYRNSKDYLFSIQKPRLKSGCGGIDLFMGGFSFLDPEYLMQKLQRSLQAAPAVAFDLALKEACPECAATLKQLEGIINKLNSLQMSECQAAKEIAVATGMDKGFGEVMSVANATARESNSATKGWFNTTEEVKSNNNQPTEEQQQLIQGCSASFKAIFTENGSVLNHIAKLKNLEQYTPYMRAYLGDVIISYSNKQYSSKTIDSCSDIDPTKIDDILSGEAQTASIDGTCTQSTDKGLLQEVDTLLHAISDKVKNKNASLDATETGFLSSMPLPIVKSLALGVKHDIVDVTIQTLREPAARAMSFAIVDDLLTKLYELTRLASSASNNANDGVSNDLCSVEAVAPIIESMKGLKSRAYQLNLAIKKARSDSLRNSVNNIEFNNNIFNQIKHFGNRVNKEVIR